MLILETVMSSQYDDMMEERRDRKVAEALGLTPSELERAPFEYDTEESDEGLVYSIVVTFDEEADQAVLDKIESLEAGRIVRLSPSIFDEEEEPDA